MDNKFRFLKQEDRKKILLLCDDIRVHSGIATMAREIVVKTSHHFDWVNIGSAEKHNEEGTIVDLSEEVNKYAGIEDAYVKIIPHSGGYGNPEKLRAIIALENPDAILIFTDPRYWEWLFDMEREIRAKMPIFYLNIWDDTPAPLYNKEFYRSVDLLMAISKQTLNINRMTLEEYADGHLIEYVPHGINSEHFYPITETSEQFEAFNRFKKSLFNGKEKEFVVFWNSRNIHRKGPSNLVLAYRIFCDKIGKEKAKECALVMHTNPTEIHGTDLFAVKDALCDPEYVEVYFSTERLSTAEMNLLYNVSDVGVMVSSNEGWGLSLTESMMAGKMIIANTTGGMQDQMRFEDDEGKWIDFSPNFPSNHRRTFEKCGEWAVPIFPTNISLAGSLPTPYIFDDRCSPEDVADALLKVYNLGKEERARRGRKGREWVLSDESKMSAENMGKRIIECCDLGFEHFTPRPRFEVLKVTDKKRKYITHKLIDYTYE